MADNRSTTGPTFTEADKEARLAACVAKAEETGFDIDAILASHTNSGSEFAFLDHVQDLNEVITIFAIIGGLAQLLFFFNFFYSIYAGRKTTQNPWKSNTLEWTTPVEMGHGNWPGDLPIVHRWPYDFSKPGWDVDFVPQNVPLKEGEEEH